MRQGREEVGCLAGDWPSREEEAGAAMPVVEHEVEREGGRVYVERGGESALPQYH